MTRGDIFIASLGLAFTNMIFMVPQSVVISIIPPYQFGPFFQTLSYFTRIHYISLFNTTEDIMNECKQYINYIGEVHFNFMCHKRYYDMDIDMPPGILYSQLIVAKEYLHMKKYNVL